VPRRSDIKTILVLGSGPIRVGQACEFDYAGTQACISLKEEGFTVILLNSNPASIMTDHDMADHTYIEEMTTSVVEKIVKKHKPCALLATMGGQTALNLVLDLYYEGILDRYAIEVIGASIQSIQKGENRKEFSQSLSSAGIPVLLSYELNSTNDLQLCLKQITFPLIIRTSFSLAGANSGVFYNYSEMISFCAKAFAEGAVLTVSPFLEGWKEFEFEILRDNLGNCFSVCCIENIDPMGVHTGDSITLTPPITLTDRLYQTLRATSFAVMAEVGIYGGGANVQFAVDPKNEQFYVIEMNPRLSRSSALASKATSFPIATIGAKLAIGYTLNEIDTCAIEPSLDYCAIKIPKFVFEKFPHLSDCLGTHMQSIGEVLAFGNTFSFALLRAMASFSFFEIDRIDLSATSKRLWHIFEAFRRGYSLYDIHKATYIDLWFLEQMERLVEEEKKISLKKEDLFLAKQIGFSNIWIASVLSINEEEVERKLLEYGIYPSFRPIERSSAELPLEYASWYASFDEQDKEIYAHDKPKVLIIGSGPNSIGQGIEFDYSCVHAARALKAIGVVPIVMNCNPETVSTDPSIACSLYFSPITIEDVMYIIAREKPIGVYLQFGGQQPLNMAKELHRRGVNLLGLSHNVVNICEDRELFHKMLCSLSLDTLPSKIINKGEFISCELRYPIVARPSYSIGGVGTKVLYDGIDLSTYVDCAFSHQLTQVFIEEFLQSAIECDVEVIVDQKKEIFLTMISEQIDPTGIHSGDSIAIFPPFSLSIEIQNKIKKAAFAITNYLNFNGIMNLQVAVKQEMIFVLEVNLRASRSIPFITKASGVNLIDLAIKTIMGKSFSYSSGDRGVFYSIKVPFFSENVFGKTKLGVEMKSTGESMCIRYLEAVGNSMMDKSLSNDPLISVQQVRDVNKGSYSDS